MNRQQKEVLVGSLQKQFNASIASYVVGYRGLSVNAVRDLRAKLRPHGAQLKVAKMRLMKRAIAAAPEMQAVAPFLCEQRAVVFVAQEPTAVAKTLFDFAKEHEQLNVIVGYVDQEIFDAAGIKILATLPSKDVLRAQVLGAMQAPISQCVGLLQLLVVRLLLVLQQINQKKELQ